MSWNIETKDGVAIVEMNSGVPNLHNPAFFAEFHRTMDAIDSSDPEIPLILTAKGKIFSAGIDFGYQGPLNQSRDVEAIAEWFKTYSAMMLRLFRAERLTVAALNGHAFAGGMILALCCDFRIAVQGEAKFSLNEVPVGVPMPSAYTEIIRHRLCDAAASQAILSGDVYDVETAQKLGLVQTVVAPEKLLEAAEKRARSISPDCYTAYRHSKQMLQAPALRFIREQSPALDQFTAERLCAEDSLRAQAAAFEKISKKA